MRLGQTSIVFFIAKFFAFVIGFVAQIYFARALGAEALGFYFLIIAVASWLRLGGEAGIGNALKKRLSEGNQPMPFLIAALILIIGFTFTLAIGLFFFESAVESYIGISNAVFFVIVVTVPLLLYAYVKNILEGIHLVQYSAVILIAANLVSYGLMIVSTFLGYGLVGLVIGYSAGYLFVSGIVLLIVMQKFTFFDRSILPGRQQFTSLFSYAKYAWVSGLRNKTFNQTDVIVLGIFVAPALIGIYSIAWSISVSLKMFGQSLRRTLFPEISKRSSSEDLKSTATLVNMSLSYAGLFVIPGVIGGAIIGEQLLQIYGPEFTDGYLVLIILLCSILFYEYQRHLLNSLNAVDRPDLAFRVNVIFVLSNVALNLLLIYLFGWVGAAIATAISAAISLALGYYYLRQIIVLKIPVTEIAYQWIAAAVMGGTLIIVQPVINKYNITNNNTALVASLVILGAGIYFVVLFVLSTDIRQAIKNNIFRPLLNMV